MSFLAQIFLDTLLVENGLNKSNGLIRSGNFGKIFELKFGLDVFFKTWSLDAKTNFKISVGDQNRSPPEFGQKT